MIVCLLIDRKGFQKTLEFPTHMPYIDIPDIPELTALSYAEGSDMAEPVFRRIRFHFSRWIVLGSIAEYRQL